MAEQKAKILVVGSFMMDLVVRTPRVPENGETIIGTSFNRFLEARGKPSGCCCSLRWSSYNGRQSGF